MFDEHLRVPEIRAKSQPALEMNEVVWEAAQVGLPPSREAVGRMAEKTTLEGKILEGNMPTIVPMPNTLEETFQIDPADIPGNPWSLERWVHIAGGVQEARDVRVARGPGTLAVGHDRGPEHDRGPVDSAPGLHDGHQT